MFPRAHIKLDISDYSGEDPVEMEDVFAHWFGDFGDDE